MGLQRSPVLLGDADEQVGSKTRTLVVDTAVAGVKQAFTVCCAPQQ